LRGAWEHQQKVSIHGWIYAVDNGLLRDLHVTISRSEEASEKYEAALRQIAA
jgi:carbonic anhydrase